MTAGWFLVVAGIVSFCVAAWGLLELNAAGMADNGAGDRAARLGIRLFGVGFAFFLTTIGIGLWRWVHN